MLRVEAGVRVTCPNCNGDGASVIGDRTIEGGCTPCEGTGVAMCECGVEASSLQGAQPVCGDCRTCETCGIAGDEHPADVCGEPLDQAVP